MAAQTTLLKPKSSVLDTTEESKALRPTITVLNSLTSSDREALLELIETPPEYIDDPELHKRGAEVTLFGAKAVLRDKRIPRFVAPVRVVEPRRGGSAIPTLTADQERQLFRRMNLARMRVFKTLEAHQSKRLTAAAARDLLAWWHRALNARAEIVRMNIPLVLAMAKRTRLHSIDFNELVSEGNMALLRSVAKFDCGRGFKFSTYSCRAILKSFSRVAMRASRYRGRFPVEFDPALEKDTYLEEKRAEHEGDCVGELKEILISNSADLSEVERTVIRERFSLNLTDAPKPKTLEQVGLIIGVTKERVRQIQNKALKKIRCALEERYLAA